MRPSALILVVLAALDFSAGTLEAQSQCAALTSATADMAQIVLREFFKEADVQEGMARQLVSISDLEARLASALAASSGQCDLGSLERAVSSLRTLLEDPCVTLPALETRIAALEARPGLLQDDLPAIGAVLTKKHRGLLKREWEILEALTLPKGILVEVRAKVRWFNTGRFLTRGRRVGIQAKGSISAFRRTRGLVSALDMSGFGPAGQSGKCGKSCAFPQGGVGQLIGKVGETGDLFPVGKGGVFQSPVNDFLYLTINLRPGPQGLSSWSDNSGVYYVALVLE